MSEQQISKLAGTLVEHQRHFTRMPKEDRQWVIQNAEAAIGLFADAVKNRIAVAVNKLLERLSGAINIPVVRQFVATEKFRPGKTIDCIKVGWLGDNFKKNFLPKVEKHEVAAEELATNKLLQNSLDPAIITALGGEEKVEVSLGQFWEFLKMADQKFWYVAYIRDTEDVLWAVSARWHGGGLGVGANSLGRPAGWSAARRFLSR
jgi:hypothetical protein